MGYYTNYSLDFRLLDPEDGNTMCPTCGTPGIVPVLGEAMQALQQHDWYLDIQSGESMRWYKHDVDMIEFSLRFPQILFTLRGEGEESGDIWVDYYNNGRVQHEAVTLQLEDFNPLKLRENSHEKMEKN